MAKENTMTWQDMKEFVNTLSEEQLSEKVICWREDEAIEILSAEELEEDYGRTELGDDLLVPLSEFEKNKDIEGGEFIVVKKKGFPLLHENF